MSNPPGGRRHFLTSSIATAAAAAWASARARAAIAGTARPAAQATAGAPAPAEAAVPTRLKFGVVGINHAHINGQVDSVKRGGGELTLFYAKEPDLAAAFAKRYPEARLARSEQEVLEDPALKLVVSAGIPDERGPLGVRVMKA